MEANLNLLIVVIVVVLYLIAGFIYGIYVVVNGGGNIFSIPVNMLFGPLSFPWQYISAVRVHARKGRKDEAKPTPEDLKLLEEQKMYEEIDKRLAEQNSTTTPTQ